MAVTSTPVFPQTPKNGKVQIVNADAQAQKTIYTGGSNGSKINGLIAVSTDTSDRDVQISITRSGTSYPLGTVTVVAGSGNSGSVASVNMFSVLKLVGLPLDSDGNPAILLLDASDALTASALTTVTAAKAITLTAFGADF
jgi:hypothetical protein